MLLIFGVGIGVFTSPSHSTRFVSQNPLEFRHTEVVSVWAIFAIH